MTGVEIHSPSADGWQGDRRGTNGWGGRGLTSRRRPGSLLRTTTTSKLGTIAAQRKRNMLAKTATITAICRAQRVEGSGECGARLFQDGGCTNCGPSRSTDATMSDRTHREASRAIRSMRARRNTAEKGRHRCCHSHFVRLGDSARQRKRNVCWPVNCDKGRRGGCICQLLRFRARDAATKRNSENMIFIFRLTGGSRKRLVLADSRHARRPLVRRHIPIRHGAKFASVLTQKLYQTQLGHRPGIARQPGNTSLGSYYVRLPRWRGAWRGTRQRGSARSPRPFPLSSAGVSSRGRAAPGARRRSSSCHLCILSRVLCPSCLSEWQRVARMSRGGGILGAPVAGGGGLGEMFGGKDGAALVSRAA